MAGIRLASATRTIPAWLVALALIGLAPHRPAPLAFHRVGRWTSADQRSLDPAVLPDLLEQLHS